MDAGDDRRPRSGAESFFVRRAVDTESEASQLAGVHIAAWQWAYRGLMPDEYLRRLDERLESRVAFWRRVLGSDPSLSAVWVARATSTIVGFASTGPSVASDVTAFEGQLYSIYLLEHVAGKGVGHALMTAAANEMRRQGFSACMLWVLESNQRARRFYEREGWAPDGGRQIDNSPGFDLAEVRYRTTL